LSDRQADRHTDRKTNRHTASQPRVAQGSPEDPKAAQPGHPRAPPRAAQGSPRQPKAAQSKTGVIVVISNLFSQWASQPLQGCPGQLNTDQGSLGHPRATNQPASQPTSPGQPRAAQGSPQQPRQADKQTGRQEDIQTDR